MENAAEDRQSFDEITEEELEVPETNGVNKDIEIEVIEGGSNEEPETNQFEGGSSQDQETENCKKPTKLGEYKVPKKIWERTFKELTAKPRMRHHSDVVKGHCRYVSVRKRLLHPMSLNAYMEMIQQAYVNKNWHNLYKIMHEALKLDKRELRDQIFKYLFNAIQFDPVAIECNAMEQFLIKIKRLTDPKQQLLYIKKAYSWDFLEEDEFDLKSEEESIEEESVEETPQKRQKRIRTTEE